MALSSHMASSPFSLIIARCFLHARELQSIMLLTNALRYATRALRSGGSHTRWNACLHESHISDYSNLQNTLPQHRRKFHTNGMWCWGRRIIPSHLGLEHIRYVLYRELVVIRLLWMTRARSIASGLTSSSSRRTSPNSLSENVLFCMSGPCDRSL